MKFLYIIPARENSKGLPGKNIKKLGGEPLIAHSIKFAKTVYSAENDVICVSTDSVDIARVAVAFGAQAPFVRPAELANDTAGTYDVILHAIQFYREVEQKEFDAVVLLQPTSPFRSIIHMQEMISLMELNEQADMVVSVKQSKENPYFSLFEESANGYLQKSKTGDFLSRQACPEVYAYNGAIYLMKKTALEKSPIHKFENVIKYVMKEEYSVDIDTIYDWVIAEYILQQRSDILQFDK